MFKLRTLVDFFSLMAKSQDILPSIHQLMFIPNFIPSFAVPPATIGYPPVHIFTQYEITDIQLHTIILQPIHFPQYIIRIQYYMAIQ